MLRTLLAAAIALTPLASAAFDTEARAAYVRDITTDTVLMDLDADTPLPPASMSKLMTLYMLFDALRDGRVQLDDTFGVSARAAAMGGSSMFLTERDRPTVEELIRGVSVQSGNDATVVIAEGLAGTEEAFARQMTDVARDLGMTNSTFVNASGWPHPDHRMSLRDLGILAEALITEFPDYYPYLGETTFAYDGRVPSNHNNRNPLLYLDIGADGLKTGHTQEAGYGLVGSAAQGDRRIVFVITGLDSGQARADESERLVNWAFRQFVERDLVDAGTRLAEAEVSLGDVPSVGLVVGEDVTLLVSALAQDEIAAEIVYDGPLAAPIAAGDPVGELVITRDELPEHRVPVYAEADVAAGGPMARMTLAARLLAGDLIARTGLVDGPEGDAVAAPEVEGAGG
ncbi:D-alanyl-D-alanine carboxypeptidase (penicillin-binding protein 5/6) [Hasllibacter halocynthiae]|uniref:serine-type D-Ala-D-Ala carboxypeptidase n=1 Tax=Hasllibacter halocynthiae TaxID=595589 RepID=A0A2T0X710_9RHOB|nr:D-alanyl-D-alanine carboxypeptidase family protein [Hasllibacter halocynthiae]PRY94707.1 D-alanyl-D-alanine carboxypeptidase (penicillin-binding protein 5/6) [Hasllibacter halocynthiae]